MATRNLTIMFTDIKGFTSRTSEETRKGMTDILEVHERLLLPVFNYFDGKVVKTIGDAFLVYFVSPTDAVLCGVTIQEVLRRHNLRAPEKEKIEVRVAINVGDVELKDNDVFGEAVNIAARLEGITDAGEVYFTDAVYQTMNRKEAPSSEVGERIFKGIEYPIRVYKVIQDPKSDLAHTLATGVQLTDKGPVLKGIRASLNGKKASLTKKLLVAAVVVVVMLILVWMLSPSKTQRVLNNASKLMAKEAYVEALALVHNQIGADPDNTELIRNAVKAAKGHIKRLEATHAYEAALKWLQEEKTGKSYLNVLAPKIVELDIKVTVSEVLQNKKYANQYYPKPLNELLKRYPKDPKVPLAVADMLDKDGHPITLLWLYDKALRECGYKGDDKIFMYCADILTKGRIDHQKFRQAEAILRDFYPEKHQQWAQTGH